MFAYISTNGRARALAVIHAYQESNVNSKTEEVIKQLNRLANDRNIPIQARNKIHYAIQHLRDLQLMLTKVTGEQLV